MYVHTVIYRYSTLLLFIKILEFYVEFYSGYGIYIYSRIYKFQKRKPNKITRTIGIANNYSAPYSHDITTKPTPKPNPTTTTATTVTANPSVHASS